ncbi:hypothetical protein D3C80_2094910 [compost metagenome]
MAAVDTQASGSADYKGNLCGEQPAVVFVRLLAPYSCEAAALRPFYEDDARRSGEIAG